MAVSVCAEEGAGTAGEDTEAGAGALATLGEVAGVLAGDGV
jgi:hypothetical protein